MIKFQGMRNAAAIALRAPTWIALLSLLSSCGGQGQKPDDPVPGIVADSPSPTHANPVTLSGAVVKGPLRGAQLSVYRLDLSQALNYDPAKVVATGTSDAQGAIRDLTLTVRGSTPLVLVADTVASIDMATGTRPVLDRLLALITNEHLVQGSPLYATPLTTLAFQIAQLDPQSRRSPATFRAAYSEAAARVAQTFPLLDEAGINVLSDPPLPTSLIKTATEQQRVLRHRLAIEALASVLVATAARSGESGQPATTDEILSAVAVDLYSDNILNGYAKKLPIPQLAPNLFSRPVATFKLPATSIPLSSLPLYLNRESELAGAPALTPYARWNIDGTGPLAVIGPPLADPGNTPGAAAIQSWTLRWETTLNYVTGYIVYFGATPDASFTEVLWSEHSGAAASLTASFDPAVDFNLQPGDQGCFRVRSYNDAGLSPFSDPVCVVL